MRGPGWELRSLGAEKYQDLGVDQYYDETLVSNYNVRYNLFILVVITTGVIAVLVPFVMRKGGPGKSRVVAGCTIQQFSYSTIQQF